MKKTGKLFGFAQDRRWHADRSIIRVPAAIRTDSFIVRARFWAELMAMGCWNL